MIWERSGGRRVGPGNWWGRRWRWWLVSAAGLLGSAVVAAPANATGAYPGETLSVSQVGPAVAGQATNFLATGQQTDVDDYAGGFSLDVFEKDPSVDPTCSPSYWNESQNVISDPAELHFIIGDWQGLNTTFSVPFKAVFEKPGRVLICAYSEWLTDTAASAQLTVNVTAPNSGPGPSGGGSQTAPPPTKQAVTRPLNTGRPRVVRSGRELTCNKGKWSGAPTAFAYGWLVNGRASGHLHSPKLTISRALRGHRLRCTVRAANAGGETRAVSRPLVVH